MCNVDRAAAAGDRAEDLGDLNNVGVEPTVATFFCLRLADLFTVLWSA